jgi:hypothetical protein
MTYFPYQPSLTQFISVPKWKTAVGDIGTPWNEIGKKLSISGFEAKALFALGMMRRYYLSANAVLCKQRHLGFLSAYELLSSGVELLGRCIHEDQSVRQHPRDESMTRLEQGFEFIQPSRLPQNVIVETNYYAAQSGGYSTDDLKNLRNLATHGGVISSAPIKGDIELLHEIRKAYFGILEGEVDPHRGVGPLPGAIDQYCELLIKGESDKCDKLADAGISPVPVQFQDQAWPFDVQIVGEMRDWINDNIRNRRNPVSGGHLFREDFFQLFP